MPSQIKDKPKFEKIPIHTEVRYIKLGKKENKWESECREKRVIRISFGSGEAKKFKLCIERRWDKLKELFIAEGNGSPTNATNQLKSFFEDDGSILWITFMGDCLYWARLKNTAPKQHEDGRSVEREVLDEWNCNDLNGITLKDNKLPGAIKHLQAFQGTSCNAPKDQVIHLINGERPPAVEDALNILEKMKSSLPPLMEYLDAEEFETLVDLVFSKSGWQRQGRVGGIERTRDIDLILPSTGEKAFIQVKFKTTPKEFAQYIELFKQGSYERMFYVYHSSNTKLLAGDDKITAIDAKELAKLVVDAGLVSWLIDRASGRITKPKQ